MSEPKTPETDKQVFSYWNGSKHVQVVGVEFARKLELERDEARRERDALAQNLRASQSLNSTIMQTNGKLIDERDALRTYLEKVKTERVKWSKVHDLIGDQHAERLVSSEEVEREKTALRNELTKEKAMLDFIIEQCKRTKDCPTGRYYQVVSREDIDSAMKGEQ